MRGLSYPRVWPGPSCPHRTAPSKETRLSKAGGRRGARARANRDAVARSAREYIRATGGGLLVGLPLLFTMEVWWHGFLLPSWKILLLLAVGFVIVIGYNALTGFRRERSRLELLVDSIEAMGLGAVLAFVVLLVLGRIDLQTDLRDAVGKIAIESIPIAFGAAVAGGQLVGGGSDQADQGSPVAEGTPNKPLGRMFVAGGGALLFALNVAPTEEPMLLGIEAEWWRLILAMAVTYLVTLAIVFYADFPGGRSSKPGDGPLEHPLTETLAAYAISLLVAFVLLWGFGRTDGASVRAIAGQAVTLAIVASFGAAAGRLLIGGMQGNGGSAK